MGEAKGIIGRSLGLIVGMLDVVGVVWLVLTDWGDTVECGK